MEAALNGPTGRTVIQDTVLTIGRVADNQLVMTDAKTSSHHAEIRQEGQRYTITDLRSTNGTFVNEQPIQPQTPQVLQSGDVIRIGDTRYTFEMSGAAPLDATVYAAPGFEQPRYEPTIMAPPPVPHYGAGEPQNLPNAGAAGYQYAPPPPPSQQPFSQYSPPPQQGAAPSYPYPQPGFVPAGPGGMPQYPGQVPPRKRSFKGLFIGLGILLLVVVIACAAIGFAASRVAGASATLDTFCTALKAKDYRTVYQQFSTKSNLRSGTTAVSEDQFVTIFSRAVDTHGGVSTCTPDNVNENGSRATGTVEYTFGDGTHETDDTVLAKDDVGWRLMTLTARTA